VEAVAFAVPPEVQAELALVAAKVGKHLLLEKPVAMTVAAVHALRDAATSAGVASVVFFTDRFADASRAREHELPRRHLVREVPSADTHVDPRW
jgi:predicted dehydrogenase